MPIYYSMGIKDLNESNFTVEVSRGISVVDFWADWCGPCKMLSPILESLALNYSGRIRVYKVNVDRCPNLAALFGIMSIPTVIIFKDGVAIDHIIGLHPKDKYTFAIDNILTSKKQ